jgi:hypothetical protein
MHSAIECPSDCSRNFPTANLQAAQAAQTESAVRARIEMGRKDAVMAVGAPSGLLEGAVALAVRHILNHPASSQTSSTV